jgi:hypothetical protein
MEKYEFEFVTSTCTRHNYPFALEDGDRLAPMAIELVDRLAIWWQFVASLAWVVLTLVLCALAVMSVCIISSVELFPFRFRRFGGDVRREFMQRLCAALHGTLGSYLRDALP